MRLTPWMKRLLRLLIALLGAGVGAAAALAGITVLKMSNPMMTTSVANVIIAYAAAIGVGALAGFVISRRVVDVLTERAARMEQWLSTVSLGQLVGNTLGLICGLIVAALLAQILHFLGDSMFTATMALLLYLVLGTVGLTIGRLREKDVTRLIDRMGGMHGRRFTRKLHRGTLKPRQASRLADTSVLIDGRLLEVYRTGFLDGELVVPACVLSELQAIADAADPLKRARGQRGLDMLNKLKAAGCPVHIDEHTMTGDADSQLLQLARQLGLPLLTGDQGLMRAAQLCGVKVLNLNALANALRPAVHAGDELTVLIAKDGKEPSQGVGYLDDGTMVVVDGGRPHMGQAVTAVVTSALQTNAGRMVFARLKD